MVGGKTITSHGILKHWTGENLDDSLGLRGQWSRCREGHFYYWLSDPPESCPICGEAQGSSPMDLLFPKHGFSSAAWDPPKWGTEIDIIGDVQTATLTFASQDRPSHQLLREDFGGIRNLTARYQEDGELLVYNAGDEHKGFAVCLSCGYSRSEESIAKGAVDLPRGFDRHAPLSSISPYRSCWGSDPGPVLRNQTLGAREITDVLFLDFERCLKQTDSTVEIVTTIGHALQRAGCEALELDAIEIGILATPTKLGYGVLLYDSVPGGAGHVRELQEMGRDLIGAARQALYVNEDHHNKCETACLECLLGFHAQRAAMHGSLQRRVALGVLDSLIGGSTAGLRPRSKPVPANSTEGQVSASDRLSKAKARIRKRKG